MTTLRGDLIQAVPLMEGQISVGAGDYHADGVIHCEEAGSILLPFPSGDVTYEMLAGADRGYIGPFTVVSGKFTFE